MTAPLGKAATLVSDINAQELRFAAEMLRSMRGEKSLLQQGSIAIQKAYLVLEAIADEKDKKMGHTK